MRKREALYKILDINTIWENNLLDIHKKDNKIYSNETYLSLANELIYCFHKRKKIPYIYWAILSNGKPPISLFNSKYMKSINMYFDKLLEIYDVKIKVFIYEEGYSDIESIVSSLHS
ncbi:MAG: hypothetical protein O4749_02275 [Trichodesmium sp. St5_bin2_1]|nr:hypothetical protein [Trichodesmium sp. St5_bin2_1]